MRPAPSSEPPAEEHSLLPSDRERTPTVPSRMSRSRGQSPSRRRPWAVIAAVIAGVGLIAVGAVVLFGGGSAPGPGGSPSAPARDAFVLPLAKTSTVALQRRNAAAARNAATAIQSTLSGFYDAAFMDPGTRRQGLPSGAWEAFAKGLRKRARADADALTLGEAAASIERLSVTNASLSVRLLIDPRGRPTAAFATVVLDASGTGSG